ncbi:HAD family hydrolase [Salinicoccus sp. ID82-1]|uniref:HAD family hydrolase n=1 Tax=Salinicoccus sp. ID82-1 TaxID=2820269 RepID=UPI001F47DE45|nr:HAD family hydrolase [Salinicoccus sp. ID82-1]MCG1009584.1 HAD family hydrolase [Salinicoccus sp. ID82-1]
MTRVILFDKDGTLMDYHKVWTPYAKRSIEAFAEAFDCHDIKDELAHRLGLINGQIAPNSVLASGTGDIIQDQFERYQTGGGKWMKDFYEENLDALRDSMELIDGAADVLRQLAADGYKNIIVTSDSRLSTEYFIRKFSLESVVHEVVAGDDSPFHKPDIRILEPLCRKTGHSLDEMVMIGDNRADTMLGYEEGLRTIGVLSGTCRREDLEGADMILQSVTDVIDDGRFILAEDGADHA